jgi:hypothetical protein
MEITVLLAMAGTLIESRSDEDEQDAEPASD